MLDVLIATTGARMPGGLEHIPGEYRVLTDTRTGWARSANALLDEADYAGHDALFLDDDVTILPETFAAMQTWLPLADVIGFQLWDNARARIVSAGHVLHGGALLPNVRQQEPGYLAHVTASLLYIKRRVIRAGVRFPEWPGVHSEDVAFTYDAWLRGYRVLYWPSPALHDIQPNGIGATKAHTESLADRLGQNTSYLHDWMAARGVWDAAARGDIPVGRLPVETAVCS